MNTLRLSFSARWALWSAIAVGVGIAVMMAVLIFGPDLPEVIGNGLIGAFLGIPLGIFQGRLLRRHGISAAAWTLALAVSVIVAALIVQGPLEETGWGLLPEGAAHALVMGSLLAASTYAVLRHRLTRPVGWAAAVLAAAFVGEMLGRLVGLVTPPPLNLIVVFVVWHALIGVAVVLLVRPGPSRPEEVSTQDRIRATTS
jgi:hypothetical protein